MFFSKIFKSKVSSVISVLYIKVITEDYRVYIVDILKYLGLSSKIFGFATGVYNIEPNSHPYYNKMRAK